MKIETTGWAIAYRPYGQRERPFVLDPFTVNAARDDAIRCYVGDDKKAWRWWRRGGCVKVVKVRIIAEVEE